MGQNNVYLYTVYRNSDDKIMILDGTASECARVMGLGRLSSFYVLLSRSDGKNGKWTVIKTSRKKVAEDMEG